MYVLSEFPLEALCLARKFIEVQYKLLDIDKRIMEYNSNIFRSKQTDRGRHDDRRKDRNGNEEVTLHHARYFV